MTLPTWNWEATTLPEQNVPFLIKGITGIYTWSECRCGCGRPSVYREDGEKDRLFTFLARAGDQGIDSTMAAALATLALVEDHPELLDNEEFNQFIGGSDNEDLGDTSFDDNEPFPFMRRPNTGPTWGINFDWNNPRGDPRLN